MFESGQVFFHDHILAPQYQTNYHTLRNPLPDCNDRTGRRLNNLFLVEQGLLDIPILYLSRYIIENKSAYYSGLRGITEQGAWESWILYMLEAVEQTARETREKILAIRDLMNADIKKVKVELPMIYSKDLLEQLYHQPYCKIRFLEEAGIAQRQTASHYRKELARIGVLETFKLGREIYYVNQKFMDLLTK
jgi:Fic family protein